MSLGYTEKLGMHPNALYMIMSIEKKIAEFESVNLTELNKQLQGVEQQRQLLITNINQVQGAITGGRIMIEEELSFAGVTREHYEQEKALFIKEQEEARAKAEATANDGVESGRKVLEFVPREGQDNETVPRTDDDSGGSEPQ